ncbi:MAG: zf-HC2 domain-containing protein [Solirubrobacterales bacterium]|nr:zf-HC2 domain-containing protein [Solirubrobacterales bacterium]
MTDYLEGALPAAQRDRFEAHLWECDGSQRYLESMRRTVEVLRTLPEPPPDPDTYDALLHAFRTCVASELSLRTRCNARALWRAPTKLALAPARPLCLPNRVSGTRDPTRRTLVAVCQAAARWRMMVRVGALDGSGGREGRATCTAWRPTTTTGRVECAPGKLRCSP